MAIDDTQIQDRVGTGKDRRGGEVQMSFMQFVVSPPTSNCDAMYVVPQITSDEVWRKMFGEIAERMFCEIAEELFSDIAEDYELNESTLL